MKSGDAHLAELEFQLKKLFMKHIEENFSYHQWPLEKMRWVELVHALVWHICRDEVDTREAAEMLDDLDLLEIESLARMPVVNGSVDLDSDLAKRIGGVLLDYGLTMAEVQASVLAVHEAAIGLIQNHSGKIQKYLRAYGQLMLEEIDQHFSFSQIPSEGVKYSTPQNQD